MVRSKHLDVKRFCIHEFWKLLLNQLNHHADNDIGVKTFQKKEIHALIIQNHFLSFINLMGIDNNITLSGLTENLCKADNDADQE